MLKKRTRILTLLITLGLLSGCTDSAGRRREEELPARSYADALVRSPVGLEQGESRLDDASRQRLAAFSYETAAPILAAGEANGNYSPVSFYLALGMLANGTQGREQADLLHLLGAEDLDALNRNSAALLAGLLVNDGAGELDIANSLWLQKDFPFRDEFADAVAQSYRAWLFEVDFPSGEADAFSGRWVADQLRGDMVPQFAAAENTVARLINTVSYSGRWAEAFRESRTEAADFTLQNGDTVRVELMQEHYSDGRYLAGNGFVALRKELNHGAMCFVLPGEGLTVEDLLADSALLYEAMEGRDWSHAVIDFAVPKFTFQSSYDLTDALERMGLAALCDPESGALNAMADNAQNKVSISEVRQETAISLDEEGVTASAYTAVDAATGDDPPPPDDYVEIILNRPFLYGIFADDDTLLFVGVVRNPNEAERPEGERPEPKAATEPEAAQPALPERTGEEQEIIDYLDGLYRDYRDGAVSNAHYYNGRYITLRGRTGNINGPEDMASLDESNLFIDIVEGCEDNLWSFPSPAPYAASPFPEMPVYDARGDQLQFNLDALLAGGSNEEQIRETLYRNAYRVTEYAPDSGDRIIRLNDDSFLLTHWTQQRSGNILDGAWLFEKQDGAYKIHTGIQFVQTY